MFFRVENLGPLREAEVDLSKRMILLTGPNSTGKTYVAWSIYGLFRDPMAPGAFRGLAEELLASPSQEVGFDRLVALWPGILEATAEYFASRLHLCFAAERQHFADVKVALRGVPGERASRIERPVRMGRAFEGVGAAVELGSRVQLRFERLVAGDGARLAMSDRAPVTLAELPPDTKAELPSVIDSLLGLTVRAAYWPRCTLLPTERTAVDLFAKELSLKRTELIDKAMEAQLDPTATPTSITRDVGRYPWPIQDNLRLANDLAYMARRQSAFADLAVELETLLGGGVSVSKEGEVGFAPSGKSLSIGIHLTSSVVKSLARLVFYFRHIAREGDVLMIDEPELNLHPDNQRKVARVLAKAVNRGLRIIMSTHSDYVLRELNNLILLGRDTAPVRELRDKHGYAETELLAPDKVGVYLFREGTAENVEVTEDGFEVRSIEEEINRLNAISQDIYAALHE
jgi:hypothetical protein